MARPLNSLATATATIGLSALFLTGCASAQPAAVSAESCVPDGVQLNVSYAPTAAASIDIALESFAAAHEGIEVNATESTGANYTERAQQIIADRAAGKIADVANIGNDQVRLFVDSYDLQPFDTSVLANSYDKTFLPVGQVEGDQYAIPYQVSVPGLYINRDAFVAAGLDPDAPINSLEDWIEVSRTLTAATGKPAFGINDGPSADDWFTQALVQSLGGTYVNEDGTAAFDSEEGVEAFEFYQTAVADGLMLHAPIADTMGAFTTGEMPMLVVSTAAVPLFASQIGDAFEWSLALMPGSAEPVFPAGGNSWIVLSDDPCTAAFAQEFVAEIVAPHALTPALEASSYLPVDEEVRSDLLGRSDLAPQAGTAFESRTELTPFGGWPGASTPQVQQLIADMTERITTGADVEKELSETVEEINRIVG